jgi:hypothetical protein
MNNGAARPPIPTLRPWLVLRASLAIFLVSLLVYNLTSMRTKYDAYVLAIGVATAVIAMGGRVLVAKMRGRSPGNGSVQPAEQLLAEFFWLAALGMTVSYVVLFVYMLCAAAAVVPPGYNQPWVFMRPDIITQVPFWFNGNPVRIPWHAAGIALSAYILKPSLPACTVALMSAFTALACAFIEGVMWID